MRADRLLQKGMQIELGVHSEKILDSDIVVISPGVPRKLDIIQRAMLQRIPVVSEIEFAARHEQGCIIAVTGSNGKSTTATLIARIVENAGFTTFLAGNIGVAYSSIVAQTSPGSLSVLELSSFQLEAMDSFHPHIAVLLNLSPDHLNRYDNADEYYRAKLHIFDNQNESDFAVLWADQTEIAQLAQNVKSRRLLFSMNSNEQYAAMVRDEHICRGREEIMHMNELGIPGPHNLLNALASVAATAPLDISRESIAGTMRLFSGIEHRLERFLEQDGILFVNDSKATNPDSMRYALMSFDRPIVLIAGGYDKGADFAELHDLVAQRVKAIVFTGATGERMMEQLGDGVMFSVFTPNFEDAVKRAISLANAGDVVMLSPGCASFDAFDNFEHRGRVFKELVRKMVEAK